MNKKILLTLISLTLPTFINAHALILNVLNNDDNTITVEGIFSTGQTASGALIKINSLVNGKVLYKKRLPKEGELTIDIPKVPYEIILDGGPGHTVIKKGLAPKEGFTKEVLNKMKKSSIKEKNKDNSYLILKISYASCFILLLITVFISIKNTNKLLNQLKQPK